MTKQQVFEQLLDCFIKSGEQIGDAYIEQVRETWRKRYEDAE